MALIQPVCAPTGIDCSVALPHSIPLVPFLQLCVAGISDGAAIAGRSCRASKFDSWARLGGIEVGTRCEEGVLGANMRATSGKRECVTVARAPKYVASEAQPDKKTDTHKHTHKHTHTHRWIERQ